MTTDPELVALIADVLDDADVWGDYGGMPFVKPDKVAALLDGKVVVRQVTEDA